MYKGEKSRGSLLIERPLGGIHWAYVVSVDVGKEKTVLRRVENAAVSEQLCFSLLTKEGSLDLEFNSPRERDALVSCFSLVLDEVYAEKWRDICYRGLSSSNPSSFDEMDPNNAAAAAKELPTGPKKIVHFGFFCSIYIIIVA